jgi:hypothetical protein
MAFDNIPNHYMETFLSPEDKLRFSHVSRTAFPNVLECERVTKEGRACVLDLFYNFNMPPAKCMSFCNEHIKTFIEKVVNMLCEKPVIMYYDNKITTLKLFYISIGAIRLQKHYSKWILLKGNQIQEVNSGKMLT